MRVSILPKTPLGKWSTGLIIAFVVFIVAFQLLVVSGHRGGKTFFSNLMLTIPIYAVCILHEYAEAHKNLELLAVTTNKPDITDYQRLDSHKEDSQN